MPYRKVVFEQGGYYHVFNRGNNYQRIFFERDNYFFFRNYSGGCASRQAGWPERCTKESQAQRLQHCVAVLAGG